MSVIVELAKPGSIATTMIPAQTGAQSGLDIVGVQQGKIRMQVMTARFTLSNQEIEVTGDGDSNSAWETNLMPSTVIAVRGHMLAQSTLGLTNMGDSANKGTWSIRCLLSSARVLQAYCMIRDVDVSMDRNGVAVGVMAIFRVTNTPLAQMETFGTALTGAA